MVVPLHVSNTIHHMSVNNFIEKEKRVSSDIFTIFYSTNEISSNTNTKIVNGVFLLFAFPYEKAPIRLCAYSDPFKFSRSVYPLLFTFRIFIWFFRYPFCLHKYVRVHVECASPGRRRTANAHHHHPTCNIIVGSAKLTLHWRHKLFDNQTMLASSIIRKKNNEMYKLEATTATE